MFFNLILCLPARLNLLFLRFHLLVYSDGLLESFDAPKNVHHC